jgi:hypothetical protein
MERLMSKPNDFSRSPTAFEQNSTLVAVIEMSLSSWLVAGLVQGMERQPLKKLDTDEDALLKLLHRWRDEAVKAGFKITRTTVVGAGTPISQWENSSQGRPGAIEEKGEALALTFKISNH